MKLGRPPTHLILLVEDNAGDVELVTTITQRLQPGVVFNIARDGVEAIAMLQKYKMQRNLPDLVLLDLNLPKKCGRDVIREVKQDESLMSVPIIVLTSSNSPEDVNAAYALGANGYVTKGMDYIATRDKLDTLLKFWLQIAQLTERPVRHWPHENSVQEPMPFSDTRNWADYELEF
ncbi:MAG: response regulator [Planctomycetales bacterium]|nr:response regulator [Planctomycetales bacterium]